MASHAVILLGEHAPAALRKAVRRITSDVVTLGARAAEIHLDEPMATRVAEALKAEVRKEAGRFDVACLPLEGREKKLLLADMDSTIIGEESLDALAAAFSVGQQVAIITERAMRGELDFAMALRARVELLKGVPIEAAGAAMKDAMTVNEGAETLVRTMKARGAHTALVTGGFLMFAGPVGEKLGFHDVFANRLRSADGFLTGEVAEPILGREAKGERLRALCEAQGLNPLDVVAVGDGANDREMIALAGLGVGYRPKPVLEEVADVSLRHADLTALLSLQGIPQSEWVSG